MAWRTLFLSTPCSLRCEHGQLVHTALSADGKEQVQMFPFEDISVIVADTPQVSLNNAVLARIATHGILYVVCDAAHMPAGIMIPYNAHSKVTAVGYAHMKASKPLCKRLWQKIIQQKIRNQASVVRLLNKPSRSLDILVDKVQSGDTSNMEGVAAAKYFRLLFGKHFVRTVPSFINSCLDYGYAILRGTIARNVTASGLIPWLGVWHKNMLNAFNLVDDLMEPFRPFMDYWIVQNIQNIEKSKECRALIPKEKAILVDCLNMQCGMEVPQGDAEQMAVLFAMGRVTGTLAKCFTHKDANVLVLPHILPKRL